MGFRPTSLKPVGERLFGRDLERWADELIASETDRIMAAHFAMDRLVSFGTVWRDVADQVEQEPLAIGDPVFSAISSDADVGPNLRLVITLPFSGNPALFGCCCCAMRSAHPLFGQVDDDQLTLATDCRSEHRMLAELAMTSDLALLARHVDELGFAVNRFNAGLRGRVRDLVCERWSFHLERRPAYRSDRSLRGLIDELAQQQLHTIFGNLSFGFGDE